MTENHPHIFRASGAYNHECKLCGRHWKLHPFSIGQFVECRNQLEVDWTWGIVESLDPLEVLRDGETESCRWDEVRLILDVADLQEKADRFAADVADDPNLNKPFQATRKRRMLYQSGTSTSKTACKSVSVSAAVAAGGGVIELDHRIGIAKILSGCKSPYIKKLDVLPMVDDNCNFTDPELANGDLEVSCVGVGSIPINKLSLIADAVRHEIFFVVVRKKDIKQGKSFLPFRSIYSHRHTLLMFEYSNSSRVGGAMAEMTLEEKTYGLPNQRKGADVDRQVDEKMLANFLTQKGVRPDFKAGRGKSRFCEFGADVGMRRLTLREIYYYATRWHLRTEEYDLKTNNCKAFANTMFASCLRARYTYVSDEDNDATLKWFADIGGDISSRVTEFIHLGVAKDIAKEKAPDVKEGIAQGIALDTTERMEDTIEPMMHCMQGVAKDMIAHVEDFVVVV